MQASLLESRHDVDGASGLVLARSDSKAYFPLLAKIEAGGAELAGESYGQDGVKQVLAEVPGGRLRAPHSKPGEEE